MSEPVAVPASMTLSINQDRTWLYFNFNENTSDLFNDARLTIRNWNLMMENMTDYINSLPIGFQVVYRTMKNGNWQNIFPKL